MGITTKLSMDLFQLQLNNHDVDQLHTLIIDFFAAALAGWRLNCAFNAPVEAVALP